MDFQDRALIDQGLADRSTTVTVSVIVYYTVQFADITWDIPGFVNGLIDQANTVYRNTKNIPIRLRLHCIQPCFIEENSNMDILETKGSCDTARIVCFTATQTIQILNQ